MRKTGIQRREWMKRGTKPLPRVNPRQKAAREKRYKQALASKYWKALKAQVYEEQGGLCVCGQEPMTVLDHVHGYLRLGKELREDVRGLGPVCDSRETTSKRANWFSPRRAR